MATRDKEQLVKALVVEQAKVVECNVSVAAIESQQQALVDEVARLRLRNETLELSQGDGVVEDSTLAFLQAITLNYSQLYLYFTYTTHTVSDPPHV